MSAAQHPPRATSVWTDQAPFNQFPTFEEGIVVGRRGKEVRENDSGLSYIRRQPERSSDDRGGAIRRKAVSSCWSRGRGLGQMDHHCDYYFT